MRKFEVSAIERISVCNVIEKLAEHGIHYLPCSDTTDVIDLLPKQLFKVHMDGQVTSSRHHSAKVLCATVGNTIVATVTALCSHPIYDSREASMAYSVCHAVIELEVRCNLKFIQWKSVVS